MIVYQDGMNTVIAGVGNNFSLEDTLDCGQAFRWKKLDDGSFFGTAGARSLALYADGDRIVLKNLSIEEYDAFWKSYFDMDRDYDALRKLFMDDPVLSRAVRYAPGIRVLNQDGWEALCSFIISSNNNISRIKNIIDKFCTLFGDEIPGGGFSFPSPERIAVLDVNDLDPIKCGFRARYIIDCARRVSSKEIDLSAISSMPLEDARKSLCTILGVGPKVADCALLFGFGRSEAFPCDVWIKRAMQQLFPNGLPDYVLPWAGIAQQYIFHYVRNNPDCLDTQAVSAADN